MPLFHAMLRVFGPTQNEARTHMLTAAKDGRDLDLNLLFYTMGDVADVSTGPFAETLLSLACCSGNTDAVVELIVQLFCCSNGMFSAQARLDLLRRVMRRQTYAPGIVHELTTAVRDAETEASLMAAKLMDMAQSNNLRRSGRARKKPKRFKPK